MNFFILLFFLSFTCLSAEVLRFEQITLYWKENAPSKAFKEGLQYPNSENLYGVDFARGYLDSLGEPNESFLYLKTTDSFEKVQKYYEDFFRVNDYRILQRSDKSKKLMLLVESPIRRLVTLILKGDGNITHIKLYFKKQVYY